MLVGTIAYQGTSGYLSAVDWPLLPVSILQND